FLSVKFAPSPRTNLFLIKHRPFSYTYLLTWRTGFDFFVKYNHTLMLNTIVTPPVSQLLFFYKFTCILLIRYILKKRVANKSPFFLINTSSIKSLNNSEHFPHWKPRENYPNRLASHMVKRAILLEFEEY
ncbi:hypothetical protein BpHYR1_053340, partial [Brachionus plicatilis]